MRQSLTGFARGALCLLALLLIVVAVSPAQNTGDVRGTVRDKATNEPLIGANVLIAGTNRGAATNFEGAFTVKGLPAGQYKIAVRFLGYVQSQQSVTIVANQTAEVSFKLEQDVLKLDEVVVTGLTGDIPRSELGNSISKVSGEIISNTVTTNALDALAAKAPGVQVTRSTGAPGSGTFVTIRGRHTITGSSQPLYVVDGMIIDNSTTGIGAVAYQNRAVDIDPNDIESIEIIKGASAAAIYGSRASNGVILITTKSGKQATPGKLARINYSSSYTNEDEPNSWPLQTKYGQRIPYAPYLPGSTDSYGALLPEGTKTFDQSRAIFRTGRIVENSLSVSGGNPFFQYLLSGTWTNEHGIMVNEALDKRNIRANLTYLPLENLRFTSNSNYISTGINNILEHNSTSGFILSALRTPPEFDYSKYVEDDGRTQRRFGAYDNPLWTANLNSSSNQLSRFIHSTSIDYDVYAGLRLSAGLGLDRYDQGFFQRIMNNAAASPTGSVTQARVTNNIVNTTLSLIAKEQIQDDYILTLVAGQQLSFINRNTTTAGSSVTLPFFDEIPAGATPTSSSSRTETRVFGYFAQASVNAWDKLTLQGSLRYDGNSTFGEDSRWFMYPKASLSYRLSEESFMKDLKGTVDEVKLRGAWGVSGLQPAAYQTNYLYSTAGFGDPWGRATSANRSGISGLRFSTTAGNSKIRPEKTTELETGFDIALMNRHVNLEFTYYRADVTDLLLFVPTPGSEGYTSQYRNAGTMTKNGLEIRLEVAALNMDDIQWISSVSYAHDRQKIDKLEGLDPATGYINLGGGFAGITNIAKEGLPLGVFYGLGWERDGNNKVTYSDPNNPNLPDNVLGGAIKGAPRWASGPIVIGNPNPQWTGSFRNDVTLFRNIRVSVLFDVQWNFDVWNGTRGALYNFGTHKDTEDRDDLWFNFDGQPVTNAGTTARTIGTRTYQPGEQLRREVYYRNYGNGFNINEPFIEDGSFVKLRDISVSYRLSPVPFFNNLESIMFTLSGRNLKTWTKKYTGYDPEVNQFDQSEGRGYDYFNHPQVRSFRFGISINY
jgi:TonB-linked SusC/RagA family outer membrane protein